MSMARKGAAHAPAPRNGTKIAVHNIVTTSLFVGFSHPTSTELAARRGQDALPPVFTLALVA
jgi:hypothetical protein